MDTPITHRFSWYRAISTVGLLATVVISNALMGGELGVYVDPEWLGFIFGITAMVLLAVYEKDFLSFLRCSVLLSCCKPLEPVPKFGEIARTGSRTVLAVGGIGALVAFIEMLRRLDDVRNMGPAIAVTILCLLYGLIGSELYFAMMLYTYALAGDTHSGGNHLPARRFVLPVAVFLVLLVMTAIVLVSVWHMTAK